MNQPEQCNKWMEACPSGVTARDLSSIQTRHNHCSALLTTEQQGNRCQQSHLMGLWSNEEVIWDTWDPLWQNVDLRKTCGKNSTEVQEMSVSHEGFGCKGYWTTPPLSTVSKYGAQCYWLRTKPHNNGTITNLLKLDRVQNEAMEVILGTHKRHNHWDCEVYHQEMIIISYELPRTRLGYYDTFRIGHDNISDIWLHMQCKRTLLLKINAPNENLSYLGLSKSTLKTTSRQSNTTKVKVYR